MLEHGIGISLINSVPEELLFASLTGIRVSYCSSSSIHVCWLSPFDLLCEYHCLNARQSDSNHYAVISIKENRNWT